MDLHPIISRSTWKFYETRDQAMLLMGLYCYSEVDAKDAKLITLQHQIGHKKVIQASK